MNLDVKSLLLFQRIKTIVQRLDILCCHESRRRKKGGRANRKFSILLRTSVLFRRGVTYRIHQSRNVLERKYGYNGGPSPPSTETYVCGTYSRTSNTKGSVSGEALAAGQYRFQRLTKNTNDTDRILIAQLHSLSTDRIEHAQISPLSLAFFCHHASRIFFEQYRALIDSRLTCFGSMTYRSIVQYTYFSSISRYRAAFSQPARKGHVLVLCGRDAAPCLVSAGKKSVTHKLARQSS